MSKTIAFAHDLTIIKVEKILKSILQNKPVSLKNKTILGDLDFTKLPAHPVSELLNSVTVSSPLYFENCIFKGKIIGYKVATKSTLSTNFMTNLSFHNCTFYQDILLNGAIVGTALVFSESKLHGELHLENILVGHDANFTGVIFGRSVFFQNGVYRKNTYFNKSIFNAIAYFQACKWEGETIFREAEFRENVDFTLQKTFSTMSFNFSVFKKAVFFEGSIFGDNLEIDHVSAEKIVLSDCQFWQKLNFENLDSKETLLNNSIFFTSIPDFTKIKHPNSILELSDIRYLNSIK